MYDEQIQQELERNLEVQLKNNRDNVLELAYLLANSSTIEALDQLVQTIDPKDTYYGTLLGLIHDANTQLE